MSSVDSSFIVSLASFVVSIVALFISSYSFIRYDRKIKQQTIDHNEARSRKEREAEYLFKSAHIDVSVLMSNPDGYVLRIRNTGCVIAKDVRVVCKPDVLSGGFFYGPSIENGQCAEQPITFGMITQDWLDVSVEWDDGNGHHKNERLVYPTKI